MAHNQQIYHNYGGAGPLLLGFSTAECVVAVALLFFRLYGASIGAGRIRWDFAFVSAGTILGLATQALFVLACMNGMGQHMTNLSLPQLWLALQYTWVGVLVGLIGVTIAKFGIVALYLQVTTPQQIKRRLFLWAIGAIIGLTGTALSILTITQCDPYDRLWNRYKPGTCDRQTLAVHFGYFHGAVSAAADIILVVYPVTIVWTLQATLRVKFGFCMLMAGGILPAAAAILRTYYIQRLEAPLDFTYKFVPFLSWASTELWFVIILGSIPPLRPLFLRWFGHARSHFSESFGYSRQSATRSVPLRSTTRTVARNGSQSSRIMVLGDESQENILGKMGDEQIVISKGYEVTVEKGRHSGLDRGL